MLAKGGGGQAKKGSFKTTDGLAQVRAQTPHSEQKLWGQEGAQGIGNMCLNEKGPVRLHRVFIPEYVVLVFPGCNQLNSLKQHKCILLWSPEVQNESLRLKSMGWQGCTPSRGSRGESVSLPFPLSRGHLLSLAPSPSFLCLQCASLQPQPLSSHLLLRLRAPCPLLIRTFVVTLGSSS